MNVDSILRKIGEKKDVFVVQVGAMDGVSFDDLRGYIDLFNWNGLFVEPMPEMFERLVASHDNNQQANRVFENSAISSEKGEIEFIRIPPAVVDQGLVHSCFNGMASIYPPKNGLGSEGDRETVEKYGERIKVPCMTLNDLFVKHNINNMSIFACDAEGHDWEIFKQLDLNKYSPDYIKLEVCCLNDQDLDLIKSKLTQHKYKYQVIGQDIHAEKNVVEKSIEHESIEVKPDNLTIVTGIWDLNRDEAGDGFKRPFDFYIENFKKLLQADVPMVIYIEEQHQHIVKSARAGKEDITDIRIREVDDFKQLEMYDKIQSIRTSKDWLSQAEWLTRSSQGTMKMYNPMVMSKMFMLNDARIWNPFGTEYMAWIDGGITNTVHPGYFTHDKVFDKVTSDMGKFFFVSFPYTGNTEIHGFDRTGMNEYSGVSSVDYVCRGGFFGGHIDHIAEANGHYYGVLNQTINDGYMGTEESVFTIMTYQQPDQYNRFMIQDNGLISNYFEHVKNNNVKLAKPMIKIEDNPLDLNLNNISVALYVITFNSPKQFDALIKSYTTQSGFINDTANYVVNNSTDRTTDAEYDRLCKKYNFTQIKKDNIGICGGRQFVAEHFDQTDHDLYIFLEDDMMLKNTEQTSEHCCKCGFAPHVDHLYTRVQQIIAQEGYDFLKFSFSEFFGDNHTQWAWYNVPNNFRIKHWPNNCRLPKHGLSPNAPKTKFNNIKSLNGTPYADGEIYYCNWPQIVSRPGNKKMFLETKWDHPHEQTWMSHMFQMSVNDELNGAILLASPINHNRFDHYDSSLRVES